MGDDVRDDDRRALLELGTTAAREGRIAVALAALEQLEAAEPGAAPADRVEEARLLAALVDCRLARGDLAEAMRCTDRLVALTSRHDVAAAVAEHALGELEIAVGTPERALAHYLAAGELDDADVVGPEQLPWRAGAAVALVRTGQRDVDGLARAHHARAVRSRSPIALANALRVLATVGETGHALDLLRQARACLEGVVAGRLTAQVDTDLAGLLMLQPGPGSTVEAVALLRSAERYAAEETLWPLQSRIRRLLERAGETPQRGHTEALASLTEAERRVALLASGSHTNRQIAEHLLVSVKAVEWHLSRVYRKLGISSRRALATTLGPVETTA